MANLLVTILRLPFVLIGAVIKTLLGALGYLLGFAVIAKDSFASRLMSRSASGGFLRSTVAMFQSSAAHFANNL